MPQYHPIHTLALVFFCATPLLHSRSVQPLPRAPTPTDVCFRWAQQSAIVNGTLYLYGGQRSTRPGQTDNTWVNDFLALDLTESWNVAAPALTGLDRPQGPPPVALGYLWASRSQLFLYGGEYSWKPPVDPTPFTLWQYDIASKSWEEHNSPRTSQGNHAPSDGQPVQRAAEGAGVSVPSLGRGFYFGGHLDGYTTENWSQSVPRVYLQSLLEYTFPGFVNDQVTSLQGKGAGEEGVFRNVTDAPMQQRAGFTERADGLLIYIPGYARDGILLALAGGTNETFTQMNNIDVYDISTSSWYKQSVTGPTPKIRVNPCAVTAAAADGSSTNIYMFGGQSLLPYGNQTQYNDMWILTLPSFTWVPVDMTGQAIPMGRSGHSCAIHDGQMIVVGGYVGENELSCESPGVYVFNLSSTKWTQEFNALGKTQPQGSLESNPFNQQIAQKATGNTPGGLDGSYGYTVPDAVISAVGTSVTGPQATPVDGPVRSGTPKTWPGANPSDGGGGQPSGYSASGTNIAAIVIGVVCSILFVAACYLAFCVLVFRRQVQIYKRHSRLAARASTKTDTEGLLAAGRGDSSSGTLSVRRDENAWWANSHPHRRDGDSSSHRSSMDDLLRYQEPTFFGVMVRPRTSLRVVNRD